MSDPKKLKAADVLDVNDIGAALAKMLKGSMKEAFSSANFMKDLTEQSQDYTKELEAQKDQIAAQALAIQKGISAERAMLVVLQEKAKLEKVSLIAAQEMIRFQKYQEFLQARMNGDLTAMAQARKEFGKAGEAIKTLKAEIDLTAGLVAQRDKELEQSEQLAEYDAKKDKVNEKIKHATSSLAAQVGITEELIDLYKTPEMAKAIFATQMAEKLGEAFEAFEAFHKSGLSAGQAIEAQFKSFSIASLMGLSDTKGVMNGMIEQYGNVNALSKDTTQELGSMAHHFGIAGGEALKINAALSQIPGETSKSAAHAMEMTGHLAEMQGIAPGKIMADMAKNTGEMSRQGSKGAEAFGKSVVALHKMGVEMSTASKIADGLLNFEDSINAQMEASVLLNKEINLDKAREAALNNDMVGMTAEIAKNIGGSAEYGKMNRLQQDALSKSVGMTTEELTKMMDAQEESNKYFGEASTPLDNLMGKAMSLGGGIVTLSKDYGMMAMSLVQVGLQYGTMIALKATNVTATTAETAATSGNIIVTKLAAAGDYALNVVKGIGITIKQSAIGMWIAEKAAIVGSHVATTASTVATGAWNAIKFISNALGLTAVGMWIAETAAKFANVGATSAAAGASTILAGAQLEVAATSAPAAGGIAAFGTALGAAAPGMAAAVPALLGIGLAILMVTPALYVIGEVIKSLAVVIGNVLIKALEMLPAIIGAVAAGFVKIFQTLADNWKVLIPVGIGLVAVAAGLMTLGAAAWFSFGGLMLAAAGLALLVPGLALINMVASQGGFEIISQGMMMMGQAGPGLALVAVSMMGIAGGLGMMAISGLAAMPVIGALMALAVVAPALIGLGASLGGMFGGGGGEKEDKMDTLIAKVDTLIGVASQGGTINMDGKKVGEVVRLGLNSSRIK